jgi:hypothetical protein
MSVRRVVVAGAAASAVVVLTGPVPVGEAAVAKGAVQIVQAVPGARVQVTVDGKRVESGAGVGTILGPYELAPGSHSVRFVDPASKVSMNATLTVKPGTNTDVVLHRPASVNGKPVVNVYRTPRKPIGPGKARVLVAHTATVAPADVSVDGQVVFRNIANGEYAEADVPSGKHKVELLPAGQKTDPLLGPITVDLPARTVTMVYAVGTPKNGSMDVIAHASRVASDGSVVPDAIKTGSAGLASAHAVSTFGFQPSWSASSSSGPSAGTQGLLPGWWWAPVAVTVVALAGRRRVIRVEQRRGRPVASHD